MAQRPILVQPSSSGKISISPSLAQRQVVARARSAAPAPRPASPAARARRRAANSAVGAPCSCSDSKIESRRKREPPQSRAARAGRRSRAGRAGSRRRGRSTCPRRASPGGERLAGRAGAGTVENGDLSFPILSHRTSPCLSRCHSKFPATSVAVRPRRIESAPPMGPVSAEIEIDVPRERAFEALADLAAAPLLHRPLPHRLPPHPDRARSGSAPAPASASTAPLRTVWMDTRSSSSRRPHRIVEHGRGGRANRIPQPHRLGADRGAGRR